MLPGTKAQLHCRAVTGGPKLVTRYLSMVKFKRTCTEWCESEGHKSGLHAITMRCTVWRVPFKELLPGIAKLHELVNESP